VRLFSAVTTIQGPPVPTTDERWRVLIHHEGDGFDDEASLDRLPDPRSPDEPIVWIDLTAPRPDDVEWLRAKFGFHPLSVEDVVHRHQRPKIDMYDDHQFLVLYAGVAPGGLDEGLNELNVFLGARYVVTVHAEPIPEIEQAQRRWREALEEVHAERSRAPARVTEIALYVLLDTIVDGYFPLLDSVGEDISEVEDLIFAERLPSGVVRRLLRTRKQLLMLRRLLGGERDVVNGLTRRELDLDRRGSSLYFLDVYDHLVRVIETLDVYHDLTASALDAHLSVTSFKLNETMKRMTALSTILMTLTIITGVYGMNFDFMPELKWTFGYPWALGLMALAAGGLAYLFRRFDWL
jgi:magnesium transporter